MRVLAVFICLFVPIQSFAAAWTLALDQVQSFQSFYYYESNSYFDKNGNSQSQYLYRKMESTSLTEVGLRDDLTLSMNIGLKYQTQDSLKYYYMAGGMSDPEISLRYRLWQDDYNVVSIQPWVKIPITSYRNTLPTGTGEYDFELRGLWGHSYQWRGGNHFLNFESAYRQRGGDFSNELKFDATAGFSVIPNLDIFIQSFTTISLTNENSSFSISAPSDYQSTKLQISLVKKFNKKYSLQLGAYRDIVGENTGKGTGLLVSLWTKF